MLCNRRINRCFNVTASHFIAILHDCALSSMKRQEMRIVWQPFGEPSDLAQCPI